MVTCWGGSESWHGGEDSRGGWSQCGGDFQSWEGRNSVNGPGSQLLSFEGLGGQYSELASVILLFLLFFSVPYILSLIHI